MTKKDIIDYAKKYKIKEFLTESKSIYDIIDKEIVKYDSKNNPTDRRILDVNADKYKQEGYELFRLEVAYYLKDQEKLRERIIKLLSKENIDKTTKNREIKRILYRLISKELYDIYLNVETKYSDESSDEDTEVTPEESTSISSSDDSSEYLDDTDLIPINILELLDENISETETGKKTKNKQKGGVRNKTTNQPVIIKKDDNIVDIDKDIDNLQMFINTNRRLVTINDKPVDTSKYEIKNNREICPTNTKNSCNINPHCQWKAGSCLFRSNTKQIIEYINKITEELTNNELKSNELLSKENYFVSDIVNKEYYTNRPNQKIIKSNNNNIKKILSELFGKNNVPIIGKRRMNKISKNINENNLFNPLEVIGNRYYQIVHFSNQIYRAYANSYFWLKNSIMESAHRNLGYYNPLQTDLANYFKSQVIDWIVNKKNQNTLLSELGNIMNLNSEIFINDLKRYLARSNEILKSYIIDLYILSKISKFPIVLHDNFDNVIAIFDNGLKYLINSLNILEKEKEKYYSNKSYINLKYNISNFSFTNSPSVISSIYYN